MPTDRLLGAGAGASGAPRRTLLAAGGSGRRSTWRSAGLAETGSAGRSRVRRGPGVPDRGADTRDRGLNHLDVILDPVGQVRDGGDDPVRLHARRVDDVRAELAR